MINLAKKYDAFTNEEESDTTEIDMNISPDIVITETFRD